ncbi:G protein linked acetylcholine receptor GAR 2a [Trichuris trichiura]|uniref:G protein linked acetylcholine receptor GAR 2a n=1 Tax=Trichuris trichiura TaxID=36087 RepID=A0A077ZDF1_TRITR|nr:G protein linked acetylcholine receptor GAR 2a [Trichuris trichiura]
MNSSLAVDLSTNGDETIDWSSPYTLLQIIFAALIIGVLSVVTIVGNLMVMISFYIDKNIRQPSNYFIFSLAVSDFIIGLEGYPLYSIYVLHGQKWTMGWFMCDLWLSVDYTVCLASTYTVLFITIDRYCSVKIPTTYRNWRTQEKVLIIIAITWILPALLFFTSIFGWSYFSGQGRTMKEHECMAPFMVDPYFNMSMYISYYWSTLIVMIVLYAGIYRAARDLHLKSRQKRQQFQAICALRATTTPLTLKTSSLKEEEEEEDSQASVNDSSAEKAPKVTPSKPKRTSSSQRSPFHLLRKITPKNESHKVESQPANSPVTKGDGDQQSKSAFQSIVIESDRQDDAAVEEPVDDQSTSKKMESLPPPITSADGEQNEKEKIASIGENESPVILRPKETSTSDQASPTPKRKSMPAFGNLSARDYSEMTEQEDLARINRIRSLNLACMKYIDVDYPSLQSPEEFFFLDIGMKEDISPIDSISEQEADIGAVNEKATSPPPQHDSPKKEDLPTADPQINKDKIIEVSVPEVSNSVDIDYKKERCEWENILKISPDAIIRTKEADPCRIGTVAIGVAKESNSASMTHSDIVRNAGLLYRQRGHLHKWTFGRFQICWEYHPSFFRHFMASSPVRESNEGTNEEIKKPDSSNDMARLLPKCNAPFSAKGKLAGLCWKKKKTKLAAGEVGTAGNVITYRKSKSENRARKALRTITVILGAFVAFWTPFYVLATIYGFCDYCVPNTVYVISYYMCYMNSPINPFCYALANAQFKKTLSRMLRGDFHRT